MAYTGNDVINETLRLLLSDNREEMNLLVGNVSANATSLTFQYDLGGIRAGSDIDIDMETYHVWSVDSKTATVQPGMNGSTSASHTSGSLVYVNPKMSRASIFQCLNDELLALSGNVNGLYQMKTFEFTYQGARTHYDLVPNILDIYKVRVSVPGPELDWVEVPAWRWKPLSDTSVFPSGNALYVPNGWPGRTVQVLYKAPFAALSSPTDDLGSVAGMTASMQDIPALGVLLRLGPVREIKRNFTEAQQDSRRASEVPPNAVSSSFNGVRQLRQDRITTESARLNQQYPAYRR